MIDTLQCKCVGLRAIAPSIVRIKDRARKLTTKENERANKILVENKGKDTLDFQNDGFEASDLDCEGKITCFLWNIQGLFYTKKAESKRV